MSDKKALVALAKEASIQDSVTKVFASINPMSQKIFQLRIDKEVVNN